MMAGYGSSSDEEEAVKPATKEIAPPPAPPPPQQQQQQQSQQKKTTKTRRFLARTGNCRNHDNCKFLHERSANSVNVNNNNNNNNARPRPNKNNTSFLQMLLRGDMRRETSLTLQILGYIVDNNFLQGKAGPDDSDK